MAVKGFPMVVCIRPQLVFGTLAEQFVQLEAIWPDPTSRGTDNATADSNETVGATKNTKRP